MLNAQVLVLNRHYQPVHVTSVKRAFTLLYQGVAKAIDREYKLYRDASDNISSNDSLFSGVRSSLIAIDTQLTQLSQLRDQAFTTQSSIAQTVTAYDGLIQSLLGLSVDMAQATQNSEMVTSTRALAAFSSAKEYESIQRAVISAALANRSGVAGSPNSSMPSTSVPTAPMPTQTA